MRVRRREPEARSQILIVRSPAPLANHWFPGSTARLLTQPKCPEITRMSFQGACHSGFGCWAVCLRTRLVEGRLRSGAGPLACDPDPIVPVRRVNALDDPVTLLISDLTGMPSINFTVCESAELSSSARVLGRFRRAAADAAALACFAARAGGSSRKSSYSQRMREIRPTRRSVDCSIGCGR